MNKISDPFYKNSTFVRWKSFVLVKKLNFSKCSHIVIRSKQKIPIFSFNNNNNQGPCQNNDIVLSKQWRKIKKITLKVGWAKKVIDEISSYIFVKPGSQMDCVVTNTLNYQLDNCKKFIKEKYDPFMLWYERKGS